MKSALSPLRGKQNQKKQKFAVFDVEAKNWTEVKLIGFYDGETYASFKTILEFLDYVLQKRYRAYNIYAHYGGRYDFLFLVDAIILPFKSHDIDIEIIDCGARILALKLKDRYGHTWTFIDSYNILPASLDVITKSFGVEHKKIKFDIGAAKFDKSDMPLIEEYLKYDCIGLWESLEKFRSWDFNAGALKMTLALQALYVFRKNFLKEFIPVLPRHKEDDIRKAFYGGRVEIFKLRGENLNLYDVVSLYPYIMQGEMPIGNPVYTTKFERGYIGFYEAYINFPKVYCPTLPYIKKNKLLFPVGGFLGNYASCELELAEKQGAEITIKDGYYFEESSAFLCDYVRACFELKAKSKKETPEYMISKLLMNALYGKFAQGRLRKKVFTSDIDAAALMGATPYLPEYGLYYTEKETDANFIIPSISAWITARARCFVAENMLALGGDSIFYTDTDSIITSKKLPESEKLGGWKLERKIDKAVFLQPKLYALLSGGREIVKAKGFSAPDFHYSDFSEALEKNDFKKLSCKVERMTGWREGFRTYDRACNRITFEKRVEHIYDKRKILKNFDTLPLTV